MEGGDIIQPIMSSDVRSSLEGLYIIIDADRGWYVVSINRMDCCCEDDGVKETADSDP